MSKKVNQNEEVFDTMHKLEQAGMSREQAEITVRAIDRQVATSVDEVLDKIDAKFEPIYARFDMVDKRFDLINARIDLVEKSMKWLSIQGYIAITGIIIGYITAIIAILNMN